MMDFIMVPIVVGICIAGVYGLFELFVRRKERLALIEKLSDKIDSKVIEGKLPMPGYNFMKGFSFSALKAGCLLAGIGLGLLIAFIVVACSYNYLMGEDYIRQELVGSVYGASVLLFGGIGLIIAFVIELKMANKKKEANKLPDNQDKEM